ncbi:MAG: hypothetical protein HN742_38260 [Lentisphaerae bacterium]|nr:hypothetical protein [Lentisphaerota bacterium]MBT4823409.1 hypothetical protein [Lentisphaerota bacterium]MBT5608435.1 hypothetical protein [Lentisphaerota bacterium]MBT7055053.1 hypothetical protein [Lentisphaerota bacterium]MBT7847773.1 hypothetical protein [Lentisphaerota bacterium]
MAAIDTRFCQQCGSHVRVLAVARAGVAIFVSVWFALLMGCARTSLFVPYSSQADGIRRRVRATEELDLERLYARELVGRDRLLYLLERGRIAQIQGERSLSMTDYDNVWEEARLLEERPVLTATGAAAQSSVVVLNDNALPYRPAGYERVMRSHFQMLNFLLSGDLEGAGVEARRASAEQRDAEKRHDREVAAVNGSGFGGLKEEGHHSPDLDVRYRRTDVIAQGTEQSWMSASTFYLSGLVFELLGQDSDAYIDYTKAAALAPRCSTARGDAVRLAHRLGVVDDLRSRLGAPAEDKRNVLTCGEGEGWLVVLFDEDFVPVRQEVSLPIPLPGEDTWLMVSLPTYQEMPPPSEPLLVIANGTNLGETEPLGSASGLAGRALREELPRRIVRHVLRTTAKGVAAKAAQDRYGWAGGVALGILDTLTERADLRSWTTLPGWTQLLRSGVPVGRQSLRFGHGNATRQVQVEVSEGGTTFVYVARVGDTFRVDVTHRHRTGLMGVSAPVIPGAFPRPLAPAGAEGKDSGDE